LFYLGRLADRRGTVAIALVGLALELAGFAAPILSDSLGSYIVSFALFYSGHCVLAPVLPAAVSRYPHSQLKGTVMSVFNSFQFLGSGVGGMLCGIMLEFDHRYVFIALGVLILAGAGSLMGFRDYKRG
jgi:MFS family permease